MFYLKKHYFDGIDDQGNCVIVYGAQLGFWGLKIPYTAYLLADESGVRERSCLKALSLNENGQIAQTALQLSGQWYAEKIPLRVRLLADKNTFLDWCVHQPCGAFDLSIGARRLQGMGYAKVLETNIAPWHLPLSELYWGRFIGDGHYLTWVEWRGARPLKKLFWNGREITDFTLNDQSLTLNQEDVLLHFSAPRVLKDAPLPRVLKDAPLSTLAARYPFLRLMVKKRFWQTRERKYQAQAYLHLSDGSSVAGRALYERVSWEK